tara:strand:+ start:109 stop:348 length:240 start_codon:yes stop_codon:yes gene_type:complete
MKELKFYTTQGCHLCEHAEKILDDLRKRCMFALEVIDIATEAELVEKYGLRIPVLLNVETQRQLFWPFNANEIVTLLDI